MGSRHTLQEMPATYSAAPKAADIVGAQLRSTLELGLQFGVSLERMTGMLGDFVREKLPLLVARGHATPDEGLAVLLEAGGGCVEVEKARRLFRKPQGVTRQALAQQIRKGQVLAYRSGGGDYLVPVWQFRPEGGVWKGLPEVMAAVRENLDDASPVAIFAFLLQPHPLTGGCPPLEALKRGALDEVLAAVEADAR